MDPNIMMIQEMVNDYLISNGKKSITELMANKGQKEVLGVLTPAHKMVLQQMIFEYVKEKGHNINDVLGHNQVLGVISNEEIKYIDPLIEQYYLHSEISQKVV